MFKLTIGRFFEFSVENGGIYARAGKCDIFWSRAQGFVSG
jgi:hypothetical protein